MQRADLLLFELGLAQSRTHAQRLIKNARVKAFFKGRWQTLSKPGLKLDTETEFEVQQNPEDKYVSRGALKLVAALEKLQISVEGKVAIDVGQATGGFTDCLLQNGAKAVIGVEVGHDQLAEKLRNDQRVHCYEGVNARELPADILMAHTQDCGFDLAVMDVSFISQCKILPSLAPLIREQGYLISLVKPQFEVGKEGIGRGGIVRDHSLFPEVKNKIIASMGSLSLETLEYFESPITGGDGNHEFLLIARKSESKSGSEHVLE